MATAVHKNAAESTSTIVYNLVYLTVIFWALFLTPLLPIAEILSPSLKAGVLG